MLEILHRCAREVRFTIGVGEQLHRSDVRVGVRDTPGHHRPRISLFLPDFPQTGHEVQHGQAEQHDPGNERQHQFQSEAAGQCDDRNEIHPDPGCDLDKGE
ncbi:hypothetical protein D9M71_417570 [compost metagenome]